MPSSRRLALSVLLVASVLVLAPVQQAGAADGQVWTVNHAQIAPGTFFTSGTDTSGGHLRHVSILEVHPTGTGATIDTAAPKSSMPGSLGISSMVPGEPNSVAGVNGDFGGTRPDHVFMMDGEMWQTGLQPGAAFGVRRNETGAYIAKPHINVTVKTPSSTVVSVDRVNSSAGLPAAQAKTEIAMFSQRGGTADKPAINVCAVRLKNPTPIDWAAQKKGVQRAYTVDAERCAKKGATATPLAVQANTLVLTSPKAGARRAEITAFKPLVGQQVTVKWTLGGFPDVLDAMGGDPQLLVNGAINTAELSQAKCGGGKHGGTIGCNNPRTAIGVNQACVTMSGDCTIWIVVVDGRQTGWSGGMCLLDNVTTLGQCTNHTVGLAQFMKNLGAYDAINLDGGGSTGMWIKKGALSAGGVPLSICQTVSGAQNPTIGCFVNRPTTDGTTIAERPSQNAVMVLNGPDTNEPL